LWRRGGLQVGILLAPEVVGVVERSGAREMRDADAACPGAGWWAALDGGGAGLGWMRGKVLASLLVSRLRPGCRGFEQC
jgi:hypothetical protein